jgi:hypothetical protein
MRRRRAENRRARWALDASGVAIRTRGAEPARDRSNVCRELGPQLRRPPPERRARRFSLTFTHRAIAMKAFFSPRKTSVRRASGTRKEARKVPAFGTSALVRASPAPRARLRSTRLRSTRLRSTRLRSTRLRSTRNCARRRISSSSPCPSSRPASVNESFENVRARREQELARFSASETSLLRARVAIARTSAASVRAGGGSR